MEVDNVKNIVVAGAGVMGVSIAQVFAENGYSVVIYNRSESGIERGKKLISINRQTLVEENILSAEKNKEILKRISYTTDKDCFKSADFVLESIAEDMEVKREFFKEISGLVRDNAILTTNTSGLSITGISEAVYKPERFAGFHWINPPHIIPLVEIIKGGKTDGKTLETIYALAEKVGKKPINVKDVPGFCLNRFQFAILREAMYIVENKIASIEDVDKTFKYGLGIRYACLGPLEVADLGGLDTFYKISQYLFKDLSDKKDSGILKECYDKGYYGVKNGRGFYDYSNGKDEKVIKSRDENYMKVVKCLENKDN